MRETVESAQLYALERDSRRSLRTIGAAGRCTQQAKIEILPAVCRLQKLAIFLQKSTRFPHVVPQALAVIVEFAHGRTPISGAPRSGRHGTSVKLAFLAIVY